MIKFDRYPIRAAVIASAMLMASCATIPHFVPEQDVTNTMSVKQAREIVERSLQHGKVHQNQSKVKGDISGTQITPDGISILTENGQSVVIPLTDVGISGFDAEMRGFDGLHNMVLIDSPGGHRIILDILNQSTRDLVNALFVLTRSGPRLRAMADIELHFDATAKAYRDASPKPILPEEARRYKVQAEDSVRGKAFADAAIRYERALEIAPWWPEGHFNRALVLSETGDYSEAIVEMKRYLALVPDAPNARAAQDKIYEWEPKATSASPEPSAGSEPSPSADKKMGLRGGFSR